MRTDARKNDPHLLAVARSVNASMREIARLRPSSGRQSLCPNGSQHRDIAVRRARCDSASLPQLISRQGSNGRCPNRRAV
jgi:hypothetical protein